MKKDLDSISLNLLDIVKREELLVLRCEIEKIINNEPNVGIDLCKKYESLSRKYKSSEDLAESYYWFGVGYNGLGDNLNALKYYHLSIEHASIYSLHSLIHRTQISIGVSYRQIGEYAKAIEFYTHALDSHIDDFLDVIYNNMAVIYYSLKELDKSVEYFEKAYDIYTKKGEIVISVGILNNIGRIFTIQKKYKKAEKILLETITIAKANNFFIELINAEFNLGNLKNEVGLYHQSYEILNNASILCDKYPNNNLKYSIVFLMADVCNKLLKMDQANEFYKQALILSQQISTQELVKSLSKYYVFLEEQKDYERSFHYLKQLHSITNDISQEEKTKELNKARVQFENKEQELKLEKLNAVKELYDQLEVQSLELDAKNKKLENINNDLIHFSYALSHDLREPARLVKSYSDVLTLMLTEKLNEKEKQMFAHLKSGAERMEVLIEDLHRYAVLGVNEDMKKQVDMTKVLEGVIAILQLQIQESGVIITYDPLPIIYSYSTLIGQLFQNLISNAIKYRKAGEQSYISVTYQIVDNMHEIRVLDNGIGIPNSEQARIFRLFKRATNHSALGTGVGLAFCKKIMDKINGNIQVYSRGENSGSEFIISIPIT